MVEYFSKLFTEVLFYTPEYYVNMEKILRIKNLGLRKFLRQARDKMTYIEGRNKTLRGLGHSDCRRMTDKVPMLTLGLRLNFRNRGPLWSAVTGVYESQATCVGINGWLRSWTLALAIE